MTIFTLNQLAALWERATSLPTDISHSSIGPLTNALLHEALEGSDEGEYPLILEILDRITEDIQNFQTTLTWAATYRYEPCRDGFHETCVGEVVDEPTIPQFCTCPCHGERGAGP